MAPNEPLVATLNRQLDGSPYLLESDSKGAARADFLMEQLERIHDRNAKAQAKFALEHRDIQQRLDEIVGARLVYESNALELNTLSLAATQAAISAAPAEFEALTEYIANLAVREDLHLIEALGLHQATLFARQLAQDYATRSIPVREIDIRTLHAATVPSARFAGSYREVEVGIAGSNHEPPMLLDVKASMHQLVDWLNNAEAPPALAATVVHSWLTIIHPFEDGNGRLARLLANIVLLRQGWPPLIVRASDRLQYLDALAASDEGGNLLPLFGLFVKSMNRSLKEMEKPDLARRLFEADLRSNPNLRYGIWSSLLDDFLSALRLALRPLKLEMFRLHVPSESTFLLLEGRDPAGNTWLAKIRGANGADFLLWLGFMSNRSYDLWGGPPTPSIFISRRDPDPAAVHPYVNPLTHGSPIPLDEISLIPRLSAPVGIRRGNWQFLEMGIEDSAQLIAGHVSAAATNHALPG